MGRIMDALRTTPPQALAGKPVAKVVDYLTGAGVALELPRSNVLEFQLAGSKVLVRPSGTEPKIKVYLSSRADTLEQAKAENQALLEALTAAYLN